MTAAAFAALVEARRTGPGTWQARCPAHEDRSPSLSIRAGDDGRVLIHCFAGCSHRAILAALRLSSQELFAGPPLTPAEQAALQVAREERARQAKAGRVERLAALDSAERWEAIVNEVGGKLMRFPEDETLAGAFQRALEKSRAAKGEAERLGGLKA